MGRCTWYRWLAKPWVHHLSTRRSVLLVQRTTAAYYQRPLITCHVHLKPTADRYACADQLTTSLFVLNLIAVAMSFTGAQLATFTLATDFVVLFFATFVKDLSITQVAFAQTIIVTDCNSK
jgi:hypothetical protein